MLLLEPMAATHFVEHLRSNHWGSAVLQAITLRMPNAKPDVLANNPYPYLINNSLWTIQYEAVLYVTVAIFGCAALLRMPAVIGAFLITYGLYSLPHFVSGTFGHPHAFPWLGMHFFMGMVFALSERELFQTRWIVWTISAVVIASIPFKVMWIVWPLTGPYLILFVSMQRSAMSDQLSRLGDFSYGLYVWAFPVQQLLVKYFMPHLTPNLLFIAALLLTLPLAMISWYIVEQPFLRNRVIKDAVEERANPKAFSTADIHSNDSVITNGFQQPRSQQ